MAKNRPDDGFEFEKEESPAQGENLTQKTRDALLADPGNPLLHRAARMALKAHQALAESLRISEIASRGLMPKLTPAERLKCAMKREEIVAECREQEIGLETLLRELKPLVRKPK